MTVTLEMKMPDCCDNCPFAYFTEGAYSDTCKFPNSEVTDEEVSRHYVRGIPDKCPLKKYNLIRKSTTEKKSKKNNLTH